MNNKKTTTRKRGKTVELNDEEIKFLKKLSADLDIPIKELASEAITMMKKKYKK